MGKRLIGLLTDLFPVWVIIAGGVAIFHPPLFTWFHGPLITWGLAIIMLGMGVTLTEEDFVRVLKRPGPVFLGFVGQYTIMPLLGYTLAHILNLNQATSVGLILVACCPGGTASNVVTFLARGECSVVGYDDSVLDDGCCDYDSDLDLVVSRGLCAGRRLETFD